MAHAEGGSSAGSAASDAAALDPTREALGYRPALDGLRAVAVAAVIAFHAGASWLPGGFLGVSAFFTLSGFLITRLLLDGFDRTGSVNLRAFWGRRFRRLWPASTACLLAITLAAHWFSSASQRLTFRGDAVSVLVSLTNWRFIAAHQGYGGLGADPSPVQHYWSLAIEEQFYLVLPLLLMGVFRLTRTRAGAPDEAGRARAFGVLTLVFVLAVLGSLAVLAVVHEPGGDPSRAYYGTDTRVAELLVGCVLAMASRHRGLAEVLRRPLGAGHGVAAAGAAGFLAWAWSQAHVGSDWLYGGGLLIHAVAVAVVVLAAVRPGPVQRVLAVRPLVLIGTISYGLYLVHWPVFLWLGDPADHGPIITLERLALTLVMTVALHVLIEQPVRLRRVEITRPVPMAFASASVVAVLVLVATVPVPPEAHGPNAVAKVQLTAAAARAPMVTRADRVPPSPIGRPLRIMFTGDSLAYQVGYTSLPWFQHYPGRFVAGGGTATPGCGVVAGGEVQGYDRQLRGLVGDSCRRFLERNAQVVAQNRPDVAVVISGVWDVADLRFGPRAPVRRPGDPVFDGLVVDAYVRAIDVLAARGALVVVAPWPCIDPNAHFPDGRPLGSGMDQRRLTYLHNTLLPHVLDARRDKAVRVEFDRHLCPHGRYRATDAEGRPLRLEEGMHLSDVGTGLARDDLLIGILRAATRWRDQHPHFGASDQHD